MIVSWAGDPGASARLGTLAIERVAEEDNGWIDVVEENESERHDSAADKNM